MAKVCEVVDELTNQCEKWADFTYLIPPLSIEEAIQISIPIGICFATVFAVNMFKRLLGF